MARGTTCSLCGGPGHRSPTCGRIEHYKCPSCSERFTKYPRFGYCTICRNQSEDEFGNKIGPKVLVEEIEEELPRSGGNNSSSFAFEDLITVATGVAEAKVKEFAQGLEITWATNLEQNKTKLDDIMAFTKEAKTSFDEIVTKYESVANAYKQEVIDLKALVRTTQIVQHNIVINNAQQINIGDEFISPVLAELVTLAKAGIPGVMIKGPAGSGKSFSAQQLHKILAQMQDNPDEFVWLPLSFTEGLTESDFYGRLMPDGTFIESKFLKCFSSGGVMLADELDAGDPNLIMILNRAVEYNDLYNPRNGVTYYRNPNFFVVAAVNTFGRGGDTLYTRNRLDASTLDRFCMVLELDYNKELEQKLCPDTELLNALWAIREHLILKNEMEFISTRKISVAYKVKQSGLSNRNIIENLIRPWPLELKARIRNINEVVEAIEELGENDFIVTPRTQR